MKTIIVSRVITQINGNVTEDKLSVKASGGTVADVKLQTLKAVDD